MVSNLVVLKKDLPWCWPSICCWYCLTSRDFVVTLQPWTRKYCLGELQYFIVTPHWMWTDVRRPLCFSSSLLFKEGTTRVPASNPGNTKLQAGAPTIDPSLSPIDLRLTPLSYSGRKKSWPVEQKTPPTTKFSLCIAVIQSHSPVLHALSFAFDFRALSCLGIHIFNF